MQPVFLKMHLAGQARSPPAFIVAAIKLTVDC